MEYNLQQDAVIRRHPLRNCAPDGIQLVARMSTVSAETPDVPRNEFDGLYA